MKRILPLLFLLPLTAQAQDTENYGAAWTEIGASHALPYNFSVDAAVGFRSLDWFDDANRFDASIGLGYKIGKHLKLGLTYSFIEKHYWDKTEYKYKGNNDFSTYQGSTITDAEGNTRAYQGYNFDAAHWAPRHRIAFDITADKRFWKTLRVSLRERYQYTHQASRDVDRTKYRDPSFDAEHNLIDGVLGDSYDEVTDEVKQKAAWDRHLLRSRLKFAIDRKGWQWEPFVSAELHHNMSDSWHLDKVRCAAGTEYSLSKQHKISAAYVFTHENDDDGNENIHAISIGYKFKF